METVKPWWQSKTVWGGLIALLAGVAGMAGITIGLDDQGALVENITAIAGAVGGLVAIYGRAKASKKLK